MPDETILVIDDNRQLGDFIAYRLLPNLGYKATIAYTGGAALERIHQEKPALLLLDLDLPDMTGLDVMRRLIAEGLRIPTILFTAHGSEQIAAEAFRLGVHDYLVKPVEPERLEAAISSALTESRLRQETERLTQELKEQITWLSAISKVGQSVTSSLELDEVLRRIIEAAIQISQAEEGFIALLDPSTGLFHIRVQRPSQGEPDGDGPLTIRDTLMSLAVRSGRPVRKSAENNTLLLKISTGLLVQSLLYVPMYSRGRSLGVLAVANRVVQRYFTRRDEIVLASLVDYAAVALENAGLYEQARREIAERCRMEAALRESEERYALATHGANDGLWDWNLKTNQIYYSPRWKAMLGFNDFEITSDPQEWLSRIHPDDVAAFKSRLAQHLQIRRIPAHLTGTEDTVRTGGGAPTWPNADNAVHFEVEHRLRVKSGEYRWMLARGLAVRAPDESANRIAGSISDVSERKAAEERLRHAAFTDELTQLPNRAQVVQRLKEVVQKSQRRYDISYAVLYLDLDGFKFVNDSLGHPAGDQLLVAISKILQSQMRPQDMVARLGGDEFVVLLEDLPDRSYSIEAAERIVELLAHPIYLEQYRASAATGTSIGIVLGGQGYTNAEDVLRDADIAMYAAKNRGKGTYEVYDPSMRRRILRRMRLEADLKLAIENRELVMFYQPLVRLADEYLCGFEALVHWQHPEFGLLPAGEFIPLAQEAGIIDPIDWWVFGEACRQAKIWSARRLDPGQLKIFVNLTSSLLARPDLLENITRVVNQVGLDAHSLGLEIKENLANARLSASSRIISDLRGLGIEVLLDNFGEGASSLLNLKSLAVDGFKIDRSFIRDIENDGIHSAIVSAMVKLAHEIGLQIIAEGVENLHQHMILKEMGYDVAQGFLYSPPLRADQAAVLVEKRVLHTDQTH